MATATQDRTQVSGILAEQRDGLIVLALPGTDYRLRLRVDSPLDANTGERITGHIHATAQRVDVVHTGGCYFEPLVGPPRRVQGRIIARDANTNTLTVKAACPITCKLMPAQPAARFNINQLVSFGIELDARFEPMAKQ